MYRPRQADSDRIHPPRRATTECQNALDPWWLWVHVSNLSFPVEWSKIEIIRSSEFKSCQRNHWPSSIIVKLSQLAWLNSFSWGNGEFVNYDSVKSRYVMRYRKNLEPLRETHRQQLRADPWQRTLNRCFILTFCEVECAPNINPSNFTILTLSYLDSDNNTF